MARLRMAYVEYRRCDNPACRALGRGTACALCGVRYVVTTERIPKPQLIVEEAEPPLFERSERWRCPAPECGQLYAPPLRTEIETMARCDACGAVSLTREALTPIQAAAPNTLTLARRLVQALKAQKTCGQCGAPLQLPIWCPHCWKHASATVSPLPLRPTWVYVPSGDRLVPLDSAPELVGVDADPEDDFADAGRWDDTAAAAPPADDDPED